MRGIKALVGAALLLLGACGVEAGSGERTASDVPADSTTTPARVLSADELLEEVRGSVAFVETPLGTGSAVLLDDGHLVTNAHVVAPYEAVDVTFEGGEPFEEVEVVAVDLAADLALLGPIDTDAPPVEIIDPVDLRGGSAVYLIGFPGDQRQLETTLSSGVLSRRRTAEPWGLEFLQTDTVIAGGQSGGALVDAGARVIGISGMSDGDGFALSLSGADVLDRVEQMRIGRSSAWDSVPLQAVDTSWTFRARQPFSPSVFYLPASDAGRDVTFAIDGPEPLLAIADVGYSFEPFAGNQQALDLPEGEGYWDTEWADELDDDGAGGWTLSLRAGRDALVMVAFERGGPEVTFTSSEPLFERRDHFSRHEEVEVGDLLTATIGYFDDALGYSIFLEEDEAVEIRASSATGDPAWEIGPDLDQGLSSEEVEEATVFADDGGGGLFDLDAIGTYTAAIEGWHTLYVYSYDGLPTELRLSIQPG